MTENRPHPKNVPGPFYVVDGCCTACDVPFSEAPELFAYDDQNHCFVKRQPRTADELNRTFSAVWAAELQCIRYRGTDPDALRRFAEMGLPELCDNSSPPEVRPIVRDLVTFDAAAPDLTHLSALDLASSFQEHESKQLSRLDGLSGGFRYRSTPIVGDERKCQFDYGWCEGIDHSVEFNVIDAPDSHWMVRHFSAAAIAARGVSNSLHT